MRYVAVLSLVWLSVSTQPVQGNSFKAIKGKVSGVAARLLPQAVALSFGVSLLFAPLANVDAAGAGTQDRPVVQEPSHAPKLDGAVRKTDLQLKVDRARFRTDYRLAAAEAARMTNLQLKDEIDALGVGVTVDERGELTRTPTNPYADLLPSREERINWEDFDAELDDILDDAVRKTDLQLKADRARFRTDYRLAAAEAARMTNLQLKDEIDALGVGVTVDERGELTRTPTNPYADLLPSREGGERLRLLTILTYLETIDESSLFRRGAGVGRRVSMLIEMSDAYKMTDKPELREYFSKSWSDLVRNELLLIPYLFKDKAVALRATSAITRGEPLSVAAQKIKLAVTKHRNLLNKLLQGDISPEEYERDYAGVEDKIISAVREYAATKAATKKPLRRALRAGGPHIRTGW